MKSVLEILKDAKRLLIDKGWTKGEYAKTNTGYPCLSYKSNDASCFCVLGALKVSGADSDYDLPCKIFATANDIGLPYKIADWNDNKERTINEVLSAFDKAIDYEEKLGK